MDNCVFKNNKAPSSGAALYNSANTTFNITDCTFDGNTAAFAGAIANYGLNCTGIYENCIFENNKATSGGGALSNGFKADVTYRECSFMSNFANYGGAIFTQNDTTSITLDECWFQDNEAAGSSGNAGAVYINTNIYAEFLGTTFYQNRAVTGGAFSANGDKHFNIDKCAFIENVASTQGAAINFNHIDATITNTLFAKNINTGTGAGGAISSNASSSEISKIKAVNCTFVENVAAIGAGVAQWESTTDPVGVAEITLLNCLFQNPDGESYTIEDGTPDVYSLGGNQCSDQTLELYLTNAKDVHNILNEFIDPNLNNYAPTMTSAAVNAGIKDGAPLDDYLGVLRSSIPDVGYIETGTVGTNSPSNYVLMMQCIPNPAVDQTTISFNHERSGKAQISVWNQLGQQIAQYNTEKTSNEFSFPLNISQYATGVYKVQVHIGAVKHEGTFVKQ
jgi:predicted outer membrane repeat protein